jgi:hypothetical protein
MSTPRRLSFAVGTSLLTASLSLGACTDKPKADGPEKKPEKHVNEGPQPEFEPVHVNEGPQPQPEPEPVLAVNEGPEPEPEPPKPGTKVNPGPEPSK